MIIGIPTSLSEKTEDREERCVINSAYINYVAGANMCPILIPRAADVDAVAQVCDGLILPGGVDLDPTFYDENILASYCINPEKDRFERSVLHAFLKHKKPVFGICRGFQLIAREYIRANPEIELFMEFIQHIPNHSQVEVFDAPRTAFSHRVRYLSYLYGAKKKSDIMMFINSMHHQGLLVTVKRHMIDSSFMVLAKTKIGVPKKVDGWIAEAFRIKNEKVNILAVQWHPEEIKDYKLIQSFFGVGVQEEAPVEDEETELLEVKSDEGNK